MRESTLWAEGGKKKDRVEREGPQTGNKRQRADQGSIAENTRSTVYPVRFLLGRVENISREHFCAGTPKNEGPNHEIQF